MPSFQTTVTPNRRAALRYINDVRRKLQKVLAEETSLSGLTQSKIARAIGVHRSVISRELRGKKDLGLGRIAELSWAMGYEPKFELTRIGAQKSQNAHAPKAPLDLNMPAQEVAPSISFQSASVPR